MLKNILDRFISPNIDQTIEVKQKSFVAFLLFQIIFSFYSIILAFISVSDQEMYLFSGIFSFTIPLITLFFVKNKFHLTIRIYSILSITTALGYLFQVRSDIQTYILLALVFVIISTYISLIVSYQWGLWVTFIFLFSFIFDYILEQNDPNYGNEYTPMPIGYFLIGCLCYFIQIIGFISIYNYLLSNSILNYQKELKLRLETQQELQSVNQILTNLNQELRDSNFVFEEVNNKLSHYAFKNAHEVRAPLCRLKGLLNLYEKTKDKEEQKYILQHIRLSADELYYIIGEMNKLLQEEVYQSGHFQ